MFQGFFVDFVQLHWCVQTGLMLVWGLGDGFKNQEIMECFISRRSNNEIGILLYQSGAD